MHQAVGRRDKGQFRHTADAGQSGIDRIRGGRETDAADARPDTIATGQPCGIDRGTVAEGKAYTISLFFDVGKRMAKTDVGAKCQRFIQQRAEQVRAPQRDAFGARFAHRLPLVEMDEPAPGGVHDLEAKCANAQCAYTLGKSKRAQGIDAVGRQGEERAFAQRLARSCLEQADADPLPAQHDGKGQPGDAGANDGNRQWRGGGDGHR